MKFLEGEGDNGEGKTRGAERAQRPSRRARASERLLRRARVETVDAVRTETRLNFELLSLQAETPLARLSLRWGTARGGELEIVGGRVKSRAGMTGMEGRRGAVEEWGSFVGRSGRVIDGAGFGEGIVRRESREKRMRRGVGATGAGDGAADRDGASIMGGKRKGCLVEYEGDFVEEEALRLILADRMDWDSAKSGERKDRNSCSSRRGWRVK